jgi:pentalenene oxygenase
MSLSIRTISTIELLMDLKKLLQSPEKILLKWSTGSDLTSVTNPRFSFVIVNNPHVARELLLNHEEQMIKGAFFEIARESIGNGTLLADEPRHEIHLDAIRRAFTASQINLYSETFDELAKEESDLLATSSRFDVKNQVQSFTLRAAMQTLFTSQSSASFFEFQESFNREAERLTAERLLLGAIHRTTGAIPNKTKGVLRNLESLVLGSAIHIATKRASHSQNQSSDLRLFAKSLLHENSTRLDIETNDVLALLAEARVENAQHWDDNAAIDEILTLLLAGHETTASTLTWALLETSRAGLHPIPKDKIDQIILETLRLHPPAWVLPRLTTVDIILGDTLLPAHTNLLISPYALHRNPEFFPEPLLFNPARWDNVRFSDAPDAFMPFGVGPRGCIGQRFAFSEMRKYLEHFSSTGQWKLESEFPKEEFHLTLRAKGRPILVRK